jgi:hypothetical protein
MAVFGEVAAGPLAFPSRRAFLLFLVEGLFGGLSSRLLLSDFVEVVCVQGLLVGNVKENRKISYTVEEEEEEEEEEEFRFSFLGSLRNSNTNQ